MSYRIEVTHVNPSVDTLEELAREFHAACAESGRRVVARHADGTDLSPSERDELEAILAVVAAMEPV